MPGMSKIWEDENRFQKMLEVEILASEAMAEQGKVPREALRQIKKKARFNLSRISQIEKKTHHDVVAFIMNVSENVGKASRYIHLGLTSSDVLDTSLSVMMVEAADILIKDLKNLRNALRKKARRYKDTVCVGRSHGVHAEPTTFGLKMALFYEEVNRSIRRLEEARKIIGVGKISGAVGTYAHIAPSVEIYVCKKLKLKPSPISTQILQRDRHAQYLNSLAIIGSSLEKFALELRSLQRTEILEVEEPFSKTQTGSSAMPHKKNPIILERITGLSRILRANALASMENIALWHERDISHSSVERVIIPDSTILLDYMLNKFTEVIEGLTVYPENMKKNLNKTKGLIFSQRVMLELVKKGLARNEAYRIVQNAALKAWEKKADFREILLTDTRLEEHLSSREIENCFSLEYHLKNVDRVFKRLGLG